MYEFPLTIQHIFWRVEKLYPESEIVSRSEKIERMSYKEFALRVRKLSSFLKSLKLEKGDKVASIEWNTRRHLELYFATTNMGYILHTINVRFHPNEIEYVINHAGDKFVFTSPEFEISKLKTSLSGIFYLDENFDKAIDMQKPIDSFPQLDEKDEAVICYTSGTTGKPKGIMYTHRSIYIHSLTLLAKDAVGISRNDTVLVVVPMFHINGWDLPFSALMTGAKLVLPGPRPTSKDLAELIEKEKVTIAAAAPTIWIDFLNFIEKENYNISSLKTVVTGGAEPPRIIAEKFNKMGIRLYHAWGMTETEAITTVNQDQEKISSQGIPLPGIEMRLVSLDNEKELPWDGESIGELWVSGAWVAKEYYKEAEKSKETFRVIDNRIWLRTGDIVTIDKYGYIKIVDRAKDLIKSGGEWISSIDLENAIMSYYKVFEAAVVAVKDEKWGERPVALVVPKKEYEGKITESEIKEYLLSLNRFPKWWIPDKVLFINELPKTSTGKLDKKVIRELVRNM
ncbi:long-chain fatty acid--CoA ligase [Sulfurisphaera tokodaii]|uniref:Medium-chain-fatty-acid--CoA ligase n=2 Tax=Sulfurisphaera tokodaii TaxID=111955 RepID=Q976X7_SULTO|nr:long-chain fatty acid--CoA ligase [Sulfurisphaera tokodaii]BAB65019.1 medium-chain-fatty-acid--CoA ligase [Sulfurisphaera tokodaii str. 7]HII74263.1 long-chain fatty acid--CoA ligase [Sulfurisphaera tokodaii]